LNNLFINDPSPERLIRMAERDGFPLNCCAWIKGMYGACLDSGIGEVICVTSGDCSNTIMLMEVLKTKGFDAMPFAYPENPVPQQMYYILQLFAEKLGTTLEAAERIRADLKPCRELVRQLDELTWQQNVVNGWENHLWLVSTSDFNGEPVKYQRELQQLVKTCLVRAPSPADELRLAFIGVPPVYAHDLYHYLERHGARAVFNEVQLQFSMCNPGASLAEQYTNYTYPYSIYERRDDINREIERRNIDGVIHYVQAFCHRAIGDIIFRQSIARPVLTLEGNDDFYLGSHNRTRIEAFLDMLRRNRKINDTALEPGKTTSRARR
jgi:benzoyl-CoA reductase/2-hydroxyglutaryl-CoA dehydratase subunit BcrC/BadD/HgdB